MDVVNRAVGRLTSPRKVLTFVGGGLTILAFARIVVLILESYSAVWNERNADRDLMRICDAGTASMSSDFRALCLKKRAEQSAPMLLKALLRACATAFTDFCESMSSPTKVVLLLLFCMTGVAAPVVKAVATLAVDGMRRRTLHRVNQHDCDESDDERGHHEIVVVTPRSDMKRGGLMGGLQDRSGLTMRLRRGVRSLRLGGQTGVHRGAPITLGTLDDEDDVDRW